eukprot:Awhi_evm1s2370
MDITGKSDPYVKFIYGHKKPKKQRTSKFLRYRKGVLARSTTKYECLNPIYEEAFVFPIVNDINHLKEFNSNDGKRRFKMQMMDYDLIGKDDELGHVDFTFDDEDNSLHINDKITLHLKRKEIVEEALEFDVPLEGGEQGKVNFSIY